MVVKYVIPPYPGNFGVSYGIANVVQSLAVMLRSVELNLNGAVACEADPP